VIQCPDDAATEMMMPDAIDDHARRERIVGRAQPFGQRPSATGSMAVSGRRLHGRIAVGRHGDESGLHERSAALEIAPNQEIGWRRLVAARSAMQKAAFDGLALDAFAWRGLVAFTVRSETVIAVGDP